MGSLNKIINVTEEERSLFNLLISVSDTYGLKTIVRCAGGWVRDKLLAKNSHDIDIVVDNISGVEFANKIHSHLLSDSYIKLNEITSPIRDGRVYASVTRNCLSEQLKCSRVAVVKINPDQSKHLETATMRIKDFSVDFNSLRTETFSTDSRIPSISRGTPEQDAYRRDFTINSLFYNITTNEVEDFTGSGLRDLEHGIIRTPLDPGTTFTDDPLRILRALRFASRFGFQLSEEINSLLRNDSTRLVDKKLGYNTLGCIIENETNTQGDKLDILCLIKSKVSRERIGIEIKKMLSYIDPRISKKGFIVLEEYSVLDRLLRASKTTLDPESKYLIRSDIDMNRLDFLISLWNPIDLSPQKIATTPNVECEHKTSTEKMLSEILDKRRYSLLLFSLLTRNFTDYYFTLSDVELATGEKRMKIKRRLFSNKKKGSTTREDDEERLHYKRVGYHINIYEILSVELKLPQIFSNSVYLITNSLRLFVKHIGDAVSVKDLGILMRTMREDVSVCLLAAWVLIRENSNLGDMESPLQSLKSRLSIMEDGYPYQYFIREKIWEWKPLFRGKEILEQFPNLDKALLGELYREQLDWYLDYLSENIFRNNIEQQSREGREIPPWNEILSRPEVRDRLLDFITYKVNSVYCV